MKKHTFETIKTQCRELLNSYAARRERRDRYHEDKADFQLKIRRFPFFERVRELKNWKNNY